MEFHTLARLYQDLGVTASGNTMREILAAFFATVPKEDIAAILGKGRTWT